MNRINAKLVKKAGNYVTTFLKEKLKDKVEFHTADHAKYVAAASVFLGEKNGLSEHELNVVQMAAWFHDTGHVLGTKDHEESSALIASDFLKSHNVDDSDIEEVMKCILSTQVPQHPHNQSAAVLCDADLMHLSDPDYFTIIEKMRREWSNLIGEKIGKTKFHKASIEFFDKHTYHTDYAIKELAPLKEKTLDLIKNEITMQQQKKAKPKGYSRGVESMFRLTARNQINLSSIADNKSNILISVNAIIMSIIMTVAVTRFQESPQLIVPTLLFLFFCLVTIVFAILSTRPNVSLGTFGKEDIIQNKVNLLFFGNFYNMALDDYEWAIGELMKNDENLYSTMIKDQFFLGQVLAKKYKLLRIAYNVFMAGIIISSIAFIAAFLPM